MTENNRRMSPDLVSRLREFVAKERNLAERGVANVSYYDETMIAEAADTIQSLEAENAALIEIVRKDLKAWQRAAKKHRKNGNELAEEMCIAGAQNVEQMLKKMEKVASLNTEQPDK